MGNAQLLPCLPSPLQASWRRRCGARLVLWGGEARYAEHGRLAGEVMVEFAGRVVCRADGFYLGRPAPVLAIEDRLAAGRTYVVLPVDRLPPGHGTLTAASLASLAHGKPGPRPAWLAGGTTSPFEYVKGDGGRTVIRVSQEFIVKAVTGSGDDHGEEGSGSGVLCSTPELRKHYEQLVASARGRQWSPRLETIKEQKGRRAVAVSPGRLSPVRLLGLDKGAI